MDTARLEESFAQVAMNAGEAAPLISADGQDADQLTACPRFLGDHRTFAVPRASHDAPRAGPTPGAGAMAARLTSLGVPAEHIHVEDSGWSEPCP